MPNDQAGSVQIVHAGQQVVMFATPSLDHRVCLEYKTSWTQTVWALNDARIPHGCIDRGGDQFIQKIRNKLIDEFLTVHTSATDLFFLDDDIGWPATKVLEFLARPEDIIAGVYPRKFQDMVDFPVELMADTDTGGLVERDGLVRAKSIPMGFVRMKRHVLERLAAGAERFFDMEKGGEVKSYPAIFEAGRAADGWFWGEDYVLSRKWETLGGEIWVDPDIQFTHRGNYVWTNSMVRHLDQYRVRAAEAVEKSRQQLAPAPALDVNQGGIAGMEQAT